MYKDKKKCNRCGDEKNMDEFSVRKDNKDGYSCKCKVCKNELAKIYREANPEKIKESKRVDYIKNKESVNKRDKLYRDTHIEEERERKRNYSENNRDKINVWTKNYRKINNHSVAWRSMLKSVLTRMGRKKSIETKTIALLGYSALDLKNHMISLFTEGMSWDNHGEWHIDHIIPVVKFDKDTPMNIVNALSNLRPLWATSRTINGVFYEGNLNRKKYYKK